MAKAGSSILAIFGMILTVIFAVIIWPEILPKLLSNAENKEIARIFANIVMVVFVLVLILGTAVISDRGI